MTICIKCQEEVYADDRCFFHYRYYVKYSGKFSANSYFRNDCIIEGCSDKPTRKGLCDLHYKRKQKFGDPNAQVRQTARKGEPYKFMCEEIKKEQEECMFWPYATTPNGYGVLNHESEYQLTHRLVCILVNGDPPFEGAQAAHLCGNGHLGCFNPKHLKWTTQSENQMHRIEHETSNRGEAHGMNKHSKEDIIELKNLIENGMSDRQIFEITGKHCRYVNAIRNGAAWSWLTGFGNKEVE